MKSENKLEENLPEDVRSRKIRLDKESKSCTRTTDGRKVGRLGL